MRKSLVVGGVFSALVTATMVACSTSSSDPPAIPSGASSGGQNNSGTLAAHGHVVQSAPVAMDATTISFPDNAETQALAPGDTIVAATRTDAPYLRTIQSVSRADGVATFTTTDAALTDLFSSLHISQVVALDDVANATDNAALTGPDAPADAAALDAAGDDAGDDDAANDDDADADADASAGASPKNRPTHPLDQPLGAAGTFSPGQNALIVPAVGVNIDASESYVKVTGGVQFDYDYDSSFSLQPKTMTLALNGALAVHLGGEITGKAGVYFRSEAVTWASPTLAIVWFDVGVVPVPVVVTLDLATQFAAQFEGDIRFHAGTTLSFTMQEGVHYENGSFSPLDTHVLARTDDPFTVVGGGANVDFYFFPAITTIYLRPFKVAGPYVLLKPLLEVECNEFTGAAADTSSVDFYGDVGVSPGIGGGVDIFGYKGDVGPFSLPSLDEHYLLGTISEACAIPQTGAKGVQYCSEAALRTCLGTSATDNGCAKTMQADGGGTICGAPADQDVSCDFDQLLPCLCNAANGTSNNGGAIADGGADGDAGDCYAQHCVPCEKKALVCNVPN